MVFFFNSEYLLNYSTVFAVYCNISTFTFFLHLLWKTDAYSEKIYIWVTMMLVLKLIVDFSDDDNDLFDNESDSDNN